VQSKEQRNNLALLLRILVLLLLLFSMLRTMGASEPATTHNAGVPLTRMDRTNLSSTELPQAERWLLIYTPVDCAECEKVLRSINESGIDVAGKVVVVVGGANLAELKELAAKYPHLSDASWSADPLKKVGKLLNVPATAAVFGVHVKTVIWGIVGNGAASESILASWCQ